MILIVFKGATSYEVQIGPFCIQFCYLMGGDWKWYTFFSRFDFIYDKEIKRMTVLRKFTQERNWLMSRIRGSLSIYDSFQWEKFSKDYQKDAADIHRRIILLDQKISSSWEEQRTYFQSKDLNKKKLS